MKRELLICCGSLLRHLWVIIPFLGICACEFDSKDDNYVLLQKPDKEIRLGIDLAGVNPEEVIYVYNNPTFTYTLFTDNKEVLLRQFYLDGELIATNEVDDTTPLHTDIKDNKIHELKLVIAIKPGTESLAEFMGLEVYAGEFTFKLKFLSYSDNFNIRQTQDKNGNLKLEWDNPKDYEVTGYDIYHGDLIGGKLLAQINNPHETSFVDPDYAYGYKHYLIIAKVKNSHDLTVTDSFSPTYKNMAEEHFHAKRLSTNEAHIQWENPNSFPCKYVLTYGPDNRKVIIDDGNHEAIIPISGFPTWGESFKLHILPKTADINQYVKYSYVYPSFEDKSLSFLSLSADIPNKTIHALNFKELTSFDVSSIQQTRTVNHGLTLHTGCEVQTSTDGKTSIDDSNGNLHIYSNSMLDHKISTFYKGSYPSHLVSSNQLLLEERSGFKIYDINNKSVVCFKLWESLLERGEIVTKTSISPDGKYLYVLCKEYAWDTNERSWTELLEIKGSEITLLEKKDCESTLESFSFNPLKPSELIIQYSPFHENKFVIVDILTQEMKEIKGEFMNIDPFTGNLLYRGEEYRSGEFNLYVLDSHYTKNKIKINLPAISPWSESLLFNNHLLFIGRYTNLEALKEWNQ